MKTTFFLDFSIAERFGTKAIEDTYKRAFNEWKSNVEYMAELVIALNYKIWHWYEKNEILARLYNRLWMEADDWCKENYKGVDFRKYWELTD